MPVIVDEPTVRIRIYIPSKDKDLKMLPIETIQTAENMVRGHLCLMNGGCTSWGCVGSWIDGQSGVMVLEDVIVVESSGNPSRGWGGCVRELGEKLRQLCNQSEVRIEVSVEGVFQTWRFV